MIAPQSSLLKYDSPVLISKSNDEAKADASKVSVTDCKQEMQILQNFDFVTRMIEYYYKYNDKYS